MLIDLAADRQAISPQRCACRWPVADHVRRIVFLRQRVAGVDRLLAILSLIHAAAWQKFFPANSVAENYPKPFDLGQKRKSEI
jgi:hypothetical protein